MIKKLCPIFTVLVILLSIVQTKPLIYNVEAELPQQEQITKPSETTQEFGALIYFYRKYCAFPIVLV